MTPIVARRARPAPARALTAAVALALALTGAGAAAAAAPGAPPADAAMQARAESTAAGLRARLAAHPDSATRAELTGSLFHMLILARAPVGEIVAWGDSSARGFAGRAARVAEVRSAAAAALLERGAWREARAQALAAAGLAERQADGSHARALALEQVARAQAGLGAPDSAGATLATALALLERGNVGDRPRLWSAYGRYQHAAGHDSLASEAWILAQAAWLSPDTSDAGALRALWAARGGTPQALAARMAVARERSRRELALDSRATIGMMPEFKLPAVAGGTLTRRAFDGAVTVVDFWGTWCGPCRQAMPHLQSAYERWRRSGVRLLGVDVEIEPKTAEEQRALVARWMKEQSLDFPVVLDHDGLVVRALQIENYPTTLVVDRRGGIRYANLGWGEGSAEILEAQVQSLLDEAPAR